MKDILIFAIFFSGALGFVVSLVLLFANKAESFSARLLAAFLLTFSFFAIYFGLQTTDFFRHYPHFWKVFSWVSFLYMPISYIYVRSVLRQSYRFERWDFLFLIPAIIFTVSFIPVYLKSAAEKLALLEEVARHPEYLSMEPQGMLPPWTGYVMRLLLGIGCVIGQFYQLRGWKNRTAGNIGLELQNQNMYRWLFSFTMIMALFYVLVTGQFLLKSQFGKDIGPVTLYTILGTIVFVCLSLLFKPNILYGMQGWARKPGLAPVQPEQKPAPAATIVESPAEERKKSYLTAEQGAALKAILEGHMRGKKPFLKPGYSIAQLSQELNIPSYQLSGFINQEYAKNFNELINEYRVQYLVNNLKDQESLSQFTLEAIGREVGFNSRAAFIAATRKVTGKTPSEILGRRMREPAEKA
jgi:AraC-like DNA-binding protein